MNWEAISAVGEILGALAVVVSLLYLAAQIRQNSRAMKGASTHGITQTIQSELRWSFDYGEVFLKMFNAPASLTEVEAYKLGEWMIAAMLARQNEFIQYRQNLVDEDVWAASRGIVKHLMSVPWCKKWWDNIDKITFVPEFIEIVEAMLKEDHSFSYNEYVHAISGSEVDGT